jgi:hypothetical protein
MLRSKFLVALQLLEVWTLEQDAASPNGTLPNCSIIKSVLTKRQEAYVLSLGISLLPRPRGSLHRQNNFLSWLQKLVTLIWNALLLPVDDELRVQSPGSRKIDLQCQRSVLF